MGKKIVGYKASKGKKQTKELDVKSITATINLHRRLYKTSFKAKAPKAVKEIKAQAKRIMFTDDVRIDPILNQQLWRNGIRNLDRRVKVVYERKKNEDEEAKQKFFTLVKLA